MIILYVTMASIDQASGVYKKIRAQIKAFNELGHPCKGLFLNDADDNVLLSNTLDKHLSFKNDSKTIAELIKQADVCYVRFELQRHPIYKRALLEIRKQNKPIVLEIPTFPPHEESMARARMKLRNKQVFAAVKTLIGAGLVYRDMMIQAGMAKLVCIVADDYKFKKTKTIRIENGIDIEENPYAEIKHEDGCISLIAVSNFAVWNGYDRAIQGLADYTSNHGHGRFKLIFVGNREKGKELISLTKKYHLENDVLFTGELSGAALDEAYAMADIGLGALGNHRRKVFANSSLKAKEYASRGMIMILSDSEGIEQEVAKESLIVPSDETPLDFNQIETWYNAIDNLENKRMLIRNYAEYYYSWKNQINKVLMTLRDNNDEERV